MQRRRVGPIAEPTEPRGFTEYVFDGDHRLVESRAHRGKGRVDVERYHHGTDAIDVEFTPSTPGVPVTHARLELVEGRVTTWRRRTVAGLEEESYVYEGERVTTIRASGPNDPPHVFRCEWAPTGLMRITVEREGTGHVVEVFASASSISPDEVATLEDLLVRTIVEHVRAFDVKSPAYALLLVENEGYDATPPELAIGLDSEREAALADGPPRREHVWSPGGRAHFDRPACHLDEAGVQAAASAFRRALRQIDDPAGAHRLNLRVARRLNRRRAVHRCPRRPRGGVRAFTSERCASSRARRLTQGRRDATTQGHERTT